MKADGSLVSLIQGVSQQPARSRLSGQCELQENCTSNEVDGLQRRSPLDWIAGIAADANIIRWQDFVGADGERYFAGIGVNTLRIFTWDGIEEPITVLSGASYLSGTEMRFESISDATFVLNNGRRVQMLGDTPVYSRGGALVWLLGGQYGRTYRITVAFYDAADVHRIVTVTYATPNGGAAADSLALATENIATQLEAALNANGTFTPTMNVARSSDVLYIRFDDPTRGTATHDLIDLTVDDGDGGANIFGIAPGAFDGAAIPFPVATTPNTARLPRYAPHRFVVKVVGSGKNAEDDFYLQFLVRDDVASAALGTNFGIHGVWRECTAPDQPYKWDLSTMPHVLKRSTEVAEWEFGQTTWKDREAGDDNTNPPPSFLARTLNDAGTFQGRLTFAAGNSVIMSRTDKHLDFWKQSAVTDAADDPIDVMSTAKSYAVMKRIQPHNRDLAAFSDKAQFIVFGRNALTPTNAALVLTTSFECDLTAAPVGAGRNIFFAINNKKFTGLKEFYTEGLEDINDSRPITQHIRKYILGTVRLMANSSNFDTLVVLSTQDRKRMYVYEYLWVDQQKVQSSWSTWSFAFDVELVTFDESSMMLVAKRPNGTFDFLRMELEPEDDLDLPYTVMLDYKAKVENVGDVLTIPYSTSGMDAMEFVVVQGEGTTYPGLTAKVTRIGGTITLQDDYGDGDFYVGVRYLSRYIPTQPVVKDANRVKVGTGKLRVRQFLVQFIKTGFLRALIGDKFGFSGSVEFTGRVVGSPDNLVGEPAVTDGNFPVPFRENTDHGVLEIQSDSHTPFTLTEIEWLGQYTKRGKRILSGDE